MTVLPSTLTVRRLRGSKRISVALALVVLPVIGVILCSAHLLDRTGRADVAERQLATTDPAIVLHLVYPVGRPRLTPARATAMPAIPVIFFNPGWRSRLDDYLPHLRGLASKGYAVVGVERSMASMASQGELDLSSEPAFRETLRRADHALRIQAAQTSRLLDELGSVRIEGLTLDLGRVGIYGHSFGGAVALQTCLTDERFRAAANIDGWQFAETALLPIRQPWLVITDTAEEPTAADLDAAEPGRRFSAFLDRRNAEWIRAQAARRDSEIVAIANASHGSFIRKGGWHDLIDLGLALAGIRPDIASISDAALERFFDRHLGVAAPASRVKSSR